MTDKEIIKALECCSLPGECGVCPYNNGDLTDCGARICRDALHLITCRQSQIEDLKEALEERIQRIKVLEAEVYRLQGHNLRMARKHYDDGFREFAERLKEESELYFSAPNGAGETVLAVSCDDIDALVKEMTEEPDNEQTLHRH